ncbi:MAG: J domain-containing protein [bacterium]|nr:J domain-containing protein [bacterium]
MPDMTLEDCFQTLELPPSSGGTQIRRAFRRLAKDHHPDLQRRPADGRRFIRIVTAYQQLQDALDLRALEDGVRQCPECESPAELLDGVDGRVACVNCLLGETRRRLLLPLPEITIVTHTVTIVLEVLSVGCLILAVVGGSTTYALASLVTALAALLILTYTCLMIKTVK